MTDRAPPCWWGFFVLRQPGLVFRNVPAEVCANCGEAYIAEEITAQLLEEAEQAVQAPVQVDVRELTPVTA